MRRRVSLILLALSMVFSGCKVECETDFAISSAVFVPNPYFMEKDIWETITETVVELIRLIPDAQTQREVEQTTPKKELTTSAKMADVVEDINQYRDESNLNRLKISEPLCEIAAIRAKEVSQKWSHTRPNGQNLDSLLENVEWRTAGENLARYRNATNTDVVAAWKKSDSHRENLLNSHYKYCGISEYCDGNFHYISMIFTD